eukprot:TRINITY_DN29190_c0_g1_i1.p1 TRINITY_DN29190_c0_g1~~TRINITY_DN29190_c0_g1_i1.p1  ORF type:complete len:756 (-),score=194.94 TRINITY_DN29190_c0_g1_i1:29-2296(-)
MPHTIDRLDGSGRQLPPQRITTSAVRSLEGSVRQQVTAQPVAPLEASTSPKLPPWWAGAQQGTRGELLRPQPVQQVDVLQSQGSSSNTHAWEHTQVTHTGFEHTALEDRFLHERQLWCAALEQCQSEFSRALRSMSEQVEANVAAALEVIEQRSFGQLADVDSRLSMSLSDLEVRYQAERTERGADLMEVRADLDRQWEELSKGLASSVAQMGERVQQEKREVMDALSAVCADIEELRRRQQDLETHLGKQLESVRREFEEPLATASAAMASGLSRLSSELDDVRLKHSRQQRELEEILRAELQKNMAEELQVRRMSELESLQVEDSRHRRDIDALREQQGRHLEALRSEEAAQRASAESRWRIELQGLQMQLSHCMEALSGSSQLQERFASALSHGQQPTHSTEKLGDELRENLRRESGQLSDRLNSDMSALRAQLVEGLAEVRTQQVKLSTDFHMLRSDCDLLKRDSEDTRKMISQQEDAANAEGNSQARAGLRQAAESFSEGLRQEDLQALSARQERGLEELSGKLGLQGRDIEDLQKQVLDTHRNVAGIRQRLAGELDELRKDAEQDRALLAEIEKQKDAGEWSFFKALGGGCNTAAPAGAGAVQGSAVNHVNGNPGELTRHGRRELAMERSAKLASAEEVEQLKVKQIQDFRDLRQQQKSFFEEVLSQGDATRRQVTSEMEAVRSHCNSGLAGLQTQQSNTIEVLRNQQRRMEAVQGQLLGDVGALKGQLTESLRERRLAQQALVKEVEI